MRERLIELIQDATHGCAKNWVEIVADHLLAHNVMEVVRCENCKRGEVCIVSKTIDGKEEIACYCNLTKTVMDIDGYCSSGKRKGGK